MTTAVKEFLGIGETLRWHVAGWSEIDAYVASLHVERFYGGPKINRPPEFRDGLPSLFSHWQGIENASGPWGPSQEDFVKDLSPKQR